MSEGSPFTPKRTSRAIATQRVIDAAMQWHHQLGQAGPMGNYRAYYLASQRLKKACARLKKVSR